MLNQMMATLVNFFYRTTTLKKKYEEKHPNETVLVATASKGIVTTLEQSIQHGVSWLKAQRAVFMLTTEKIVCGKWCILLEDIERAELLKIRGGQVLKITTKDQQHYQFGMQHNQQIENQKHMPLIIKKGKVGYSFFSIVIRVILVLQILYFLYAKFS